ACRWRAAGFAGPRPGERCVMPKVLVLTNDFPPRPGGIQFFVHALATGLPPESVTVYAPAWEGAAQFDAGLPFPVVRHPTSLMLPVPSVARRAARPARPWRAQGGRQALDRPDPRS